MEAIKILEDIPDKKARDLSKENREKVVAALLELSSQKDNYKQIVNFLFKFHYSVSQDFFEKFSTVASEECIVILVERLISSEQFKQGKGYYVGFSTMFALAIQGKYQAAFFTLNGALKQSDKSGKFTGGSLSIFETLIVNKGKMQYIENIYEQILKGNIACNELEKKRLDRFLKNLKDRENFNNEKGKKEVSTKAETTAQLKTHQVNLPEKKAILTDDLSMSQEQKKDSISKDTENVISQIDKARKEILAAIQNISKNQLDMEALAKSITCRDEEINTARVNLSEKEKRISSLVNDINEREEILAEQKQQIEDLTERLRMSMQMDDISKKQDLLTLKNDISEALKLDYVDFIKSKEKPYDPDLFDAYRLTLSRIFKLLKRFGIECQ